MKPKAEDIKVQDPDKAMDDCRVLMHKLVRVPKKQLDARLARDKRRKAAPKH